MKNPPALHEMPVQSLSKEDPMEQQREAHSSVLVCKILWTEEPGRL